MGWAVLDHGQLASGVVSFQQKPPTKSRAKAHPGQATLEATRWFHQKLAAIHPGVVIYEEVCRWQGYQAAHAYGAYRGALMAQAAILGIQVIGYTPTEVKRAFVGKGNAKKPAMMAEARRRWPEIKLISDDHADALAILSCHLAK